jgi:MscS family membrane protein
MDFLENIIWDNTIKSYAIVFGIILLALIIKKVISRYISLLLFKILRSFWGTLNKKNFIDLVVEPIEWFLLLSIIVFSFDKLNFPGALQFKLYGHTTQEIFNRIGIAIIIIAFTKLLLRIIDFIALIFKEKAASTVDKNDDQLVYFFRDFLKIVIVIICFLLLLKACFSQPIGHLLTSLSIVGAAIALAAKESLENLIASFIIFFDKPFTTGDIVHLQEVSGVVEKIGLRSTRIRTNNKTLVTVPNKKMVDSIVDNFSMLTQKRTEIKLELSLNSSFQNIEEIKTIINNKLESNSTILQHSVVFSDLTKTANVLIIEFFTMPMPHEEFISLKESYIFFLKKILQDKSISMAGSAMAENL